MIEPLPVQISGAEFLASRRTALLADEMRCGKTFSAIWAANKIGARKILVVTTASGRAVWRKAWQDSWTLPWIESSRVMRSIHVIGADSHPRPADADIQIVSWDSIRQAKVFAYLRQIEFELHILDEDHRAKNPDTKTTRAIYGRFDSRGNYVARGIVREDARVWHLSGTPLPHDAGDMWCRLRASNSDCLRIYERFEHNVTSYDDFRNRYCVIVQKKLKYNSIPVVVGGRNLEELKARIGDWMLRRTQADIGIRAPVTELLPLTAPRAEHADITTDRTRMEIIAAIEAGRTGDLDMHLGPLRRITGRIKAEAIIQNVKDVLTDNDDKLVLAYFHREVGDILHDNLPDFRRCRVDGATAPHSRQEQLAHFARDRSCRVFLAQIEACGEAIDLSAAAELWFVESTFSPKAMAQMASRIVNVARTTTAFVKVAFIENSIDEAIQAALLRLWSAINQVLK